MERFLGGRRRAGVAVVATFNLKKTKTHFLGRRRLTGEGREKRMEEVEKERSYEEVSDGAGWGVVGGGCGG